MVLSLSLSLSLSFGVCVCMYVYLFPSFLIYDSLSLSLSMDKIMKEAVTMTLLMLSVEVSGIAEKGPFFGLKPSISSFYFLTFPVWLLRKWGKRVLFFGLKPNRKWGNAVGSHSTGKKKEEGKKKKKKIFLVLTPLVWYVKLDKYQNFKEPKLLYLKNCT